MGWEGVSLHCSWSKHFNPTVPLSTQNGWFKLSGKPDEMQEVTLLLAGFLSKGEYMQ